GDESNQYVFAFYREADNNNVISILNLSNKPQSFEFESSNINGDYMDAIKGETITIQGKTVINMDAWDYLVLVK
ncbi:MAG: hypothetical protein HN850_05085, partial [Lentimicrobiaceae bacterium]|nr:hypothetical protein [Lentimicrobiaceae bacterium]